MKTLKHYRAFSRRPPKGPAVKPRSPSTCRMLSRVPARGPPLCADRRSWASVARINCILPRDLFVLVKASACSRQAPGGRCSGQGAGSSLDSNRQSSTWTLPTRHESLRHPGPKRKSGSHSDTSKRREPPAPGGMMKSLASALTGSRSEGRGRAGTETAKRTTEVRQGLEIFQSCREARCPAQHLRVCPIRASPLRVTTYHIPWDTQDPN